MRKEVTFKKRVYKISYFLIKTWHISGTEYNFETFLDLQSLPK